MEQKNNSGTIFRNEQKEKAQAPDYTGTATVGEKKYRISGWINKSNKGANYLRVLFTEIVAKDLNAQPGQAHIPLTPPPSQGNVDSIMINDLPF